MTQKWSIYIYYSVKENLKCDQKLDVKETKINPKAAFSYILHNLFGGKKMSRKHDNSFQVTGAISSCINPPLASAQFISS